MSSPFRNVKYDKVEIEIDGEKIAVEPKVEDAEMFVTLKQGDISQENVKIISKIMKEIIIRANPNEDKKRIERFIALNYGKLVEELLILFGFTTREQLNKAKEQLTKKKA